MHFEKGDVIVTGSRTMGVYAIGTPNDHFEVQNGEIVVCWSADIDLNSAPSLTKVLNYINNHYNVDLSDVIE